MKRESTKWVLQEPISSEKPNPSYYCGLFGDGAVVTPRLAEAATFSTKKEAMKSTALKRSPFEPKKARATWEPW